MLSDSFRWQVIPGGAEKILACQECLDKLREKQRTAKKLCEQCNERKAVAKASRDDGPVRRLCDVCLEALAKPAGADGEPYMPGDATLMRALDLLADEVISQADGAAALAGDDAAPAACEACKVRKVKARIRIDNVIKRLCKQCTL